MWENREKRRTETTNKTRAQLQRWLKLVIWMDKAICKKQEKTPLLGNKEWESGGGSTADNQECAVYAGTIDQWMSMID